MPLRVVALAACVATFLLSLPLQITLLALLFPAETAFGALVGACSLPLLFAGTFAGMKLGSRISKPALQWVAYGILLAVAVSSAAPRVVYYLAR